MDDEHLAARTAASCSEFMLNLAYPGVALRAEDGGLELVEGFDRSSASYIS